MELAERNYHLQLQEMCDCYLETDFHKQLKAMVTTTAGEIDENAIKYLALALMYSLSAKAEKLTLKKKEGKITVKVKGESKEMLPAPSNELFDRIITLVRSILHIEEDKGKLPLALGLRSGDVELQVKVKREKGDKESIKFAFPAL